MRGTHPGTYEKNLITTVLKIKNFSLRNIIFTGYKESSYYQRDYRNAGTVNSSNVQCVTITNCTFQLVGVCSKVNVEEMLGLFCKINYGS